MQVGLHHVVPLYKEKLNNLYFQNKTEFKDCVINIFQHFSYFKILKLYIKLTYNLSIYNISPVGPSSMEEHRLKINTVTTPQICHKLKP